VWRQRVRLSDSAPSPCVAARRRTAAGASRGRRPRHAADTQPAAQVGRRRRRRRVIVDRLLPDTRLRRLRTRQRQLPHPPQPVRLSARQPGHQASQAVHQGAHLAAGQSCCRSVYFIHLLLWSKTTITIFPLVPLYFPLLLL